MSWDEDTWAASFRGIPFEVDGTEGGFGRKAVVHEYPMRDIAFVEDMGRKARSFTLEGFVIGDDYFADRDALIAALEQPGPGILNHPYFGRMTVSVSEFKVRESTAEGGMARFSITCTESGALSFPTQDNDTAELVDEAAAAAIAASQDDFANGFDIAGLPEFVAAAATKHVTAAVTLIDSLSASVPVVPSVAPTFAANARALRGSLANLMSSPPDLAGSMAELITGMTLLVNAPSDALQMMRGMFGFGNDTLPVPSTTTSRIAERDNQAAVSSLVQRVALARACAISSQMDFSANQDAIGLRDELANQLDTLAENALDDAVYQNLMRLRAAMVRDITRRGADLTRTVSFTPQATQPALVLAYALYEDASRDAEIVARNKVRHPGFVPGGRVLEVLADA